MARSRFTGPVFGPYTAIKLHSRVAVAANATAPGTLVDRFPMPADFAPVFVSIASLGTTANASATIANNGAVISSAAVDLDAAVQGSISASSLTSSGLVKIPKGDALELRIITDGTGAVPAGSVEAVVYGYFRAPIDRNRYAISGQSVRGTDGPQAGFITSIPLQNLRASTAQAERTEGSVIAPFPCRAMAICWNVLGQTETTGTISARLKNGTTGTFFSAIVDIDALSGDVGRTDALTGVALVNRDISRGDEIQLHITTGAADVVPIGALTAHLWVWVQGHVDFSGVGTLEQANQGVTLPAGTIGRSGGVVGPAEGGVVVLPFYNKRASNATIRAEDVHFLPVPVFVAAVVSSRQSSNSVTRQLNISGQQVTGAFTTQNYILHQEGSNFPSPGSWVGNTIVNNAGANDVHAIRSAAALAQLQFAETGAGSAQFNDSMHLLVAVRGQMYTDPDND